MSRKSIRTHLQDVSLATLSALKTLVLATGSVALFLTGCDRVFGLDPIEPKPNYYRCNCECSPNVVAPGAAVYSSPGGLLVDLAPMYQGLLNLSGVPPVFAKDPNVCLPGPYNPQLGGTEEPTVQNLQALCEGDVAGEASGFFRDKFESPAFCKCDAESVQFIYDESCSVPCPGGSDVCLVAGSDPPDPTPDPMSAALFQPTSECHLAGEALLSVKGHEPKQQPTLEGTLQIHGRPCPPDTGCRVGISYQLTSDDIEFDSGTIFADDPKFVDLGLSGATEPEAINLGPFLAGYLGEVPAESAFSTAHGRRSGSSDGFIVNGRNTEGLALAMNWEDKACRISGQIVGQAEGDGDEGTLDGQLEVALDGYLVNQPPWPDAGPDQTVECTSPDGADVTLDASGSSDADNNIALYEWRRGSEDGPQVTAPSLNPVVQTQQTQGEETYYLLVVDSRFSADDDSVTVSVADTTPPDITQVTASPNLLWPPNHKMVGVTVDVAASDLCGPSVCRLTGVTSNESVNGIGDGNTAQDWQITGDLTANLRAERSGKGNGREYVLAVQCSDGSGNSSDSTVIVTVPH
jgi:hypothetical protein